MREYFPEAQGLYDPLNEHDACGVGMIASVDGAPRRDVVIKGIEALKSVWHRGAVDADGKTGDGAGIHIQIPQEFFCDFVRSIRRKTDCERLAVGMVFLPRKNPVDQERCRSIVESEIERFGYKVYGWRQVPVDPTIIGAKANETRPEIEQIILSTHPELNEQATERDLYVIRKRIDKAVKAAGVKFFYICSLSCRSVVYKGLFLAEQLTSFYPDLLDERFVSNYAIFHQRYSTNTMPAWPLAQPFHVLAHNGEINTIRGNLNWLRSHEQNMSTKMLDEYLDDIRPVVGEEVSDTASLDAVTELFIRAGKALPTVKNVMMPPAWSHAEEMPEAHRAMFSYNNCRMEPWDGPAAVAAIGGNWVIAGMDRNGLRPMRYTLTEDGLLLVGSESGMVPANETQVIEKGRLGPGQTIAVNLKEGKFYHDGDLKDLLAAKHPFGEWVQETEKFEDVLANAKPAAPPSMPEEKDLRRYHRIFGMSAEDLEMILHPMAEDGKEPIGSMGDDSPIAVLSDRYRPLHHFFRQNFSQVTNPPIDSLREHRVMSLNTRLGNKGNMLATGPELAKMLLMKSPAILNQEFNVLTDYIKGGFHTIDATFDVSEGEAGLRKALDRIRDEAMEAVKSDEYYIILTDEQMNADKAPIPMILAVGAVHNHLVKHKSRKRTSILVRTAECMDVHYFAVLIGVGATVINPWLAEATLRNRHTKELFGDMRIEEVLENYRKALDQGMLKIMSKMGISILSSYRGGYNFEIIGLARSLVYEFFPGLPSRISGISLEGLARKVLRLHEEAYSIAETTPLPIGGFYRYRARGEKHGFDGSLLHLLQEAVTKGAYQKYKEYADKTNHLGTINLRDLMDFKPGRKPIPLEEVESITEIRKRFITPAMSLGALSPEAHETLTIAMNRIGAGSNSGEGGEGPERYHPRANGDNANSSIKQIASGRFGVTADYLNHCREIQIKVAQGAKPGEGGQLPGFKVTTEIARLRFATPGVTLISPPPHHDIYSIEDLAQLIYDLKQINPEALVSVKLVSQAGIGTIASGVAKAMADKIIVSGNSGGTGASPFSSIKFAGIPWEMGLSETNQVLTLNRLRHRVRLQTDGGLKTGRDIVIAAMLGAEEFAVGTLSLIAMGCILVRQCHSNVCPVGICTQKEDLRAKFEGNVEKVINLMSFLAEDVREILASLGFSKLDDIVGRSDLLQQVTRGPEELVDLDLNPLLVQVDPGIQSRIYTVEGRNEVPPSLDEQIIKDAGDAFHRNEKIELAYTIHNTMRAIGTRLSSLMVRQLETQKLQPDYITLRLRGTAGQSLGAFAVNGLKIIVNGDANDYVGKGLSGGTIIVLPRASSKLTTWKNTIIGNTVLYGATSGKLFAAGQAGERFAVRNSGARVVVEGCGSNGCEYMTGGMAVLLGEVGDNFGAGMSGGMAFVYDKAETFAKRINPESLIYQRIDSAYWETKLKELIAEHVEETRSPHGDDILTNWELEKGHFWQVCPKEMIDKLPRPLSDRTEAKKRA